jgi:hypothetical protein
MRTFLRPLPFLLLSLILAGSIQGQDIYEQEKGLYSTAGLTDTVNVGRQNKLVIKSATSLAGTINISVAEQDKVSLVYFKKARAETRSRAIDYIDLQAASLTVLPEHVRLELRAPNPAPWGNEVEAGMIDVELVVPRGFTVELDATYYNLVARGPLRGIIVQSSLGRFDVADVTDHLEISTKNRRVKLENISGSITVSTTNSSLIATNIESPRGTATFRNDGGDIKIDGFRGQINVKNSFGKIVVSGFSPSGESNFIRDVSGPITLEITDMSKGQLVVNNRYEDINITIPQDLKGYFSLAVDQDGLIEAINFPFTTDLVERDRLSLSSGSDNVEIVGAIRGTGNIYLRGAKGE